MSILRKVSIRKEKKRIEGNAVKKIKNNKMD